MELLKVEDVSFKYEAINVLENVSLTLNEGEIVSILGISGSGKSTLFNIIAGILQPDTGRIYYKDTDITGKTGFISYMLQKDLLLPFRTIIDNVSLPLVIKGASKKAARTKAAAYLEEFGLTNTENKYPHQLSGGMRQRAALLRTYLFSNEIALLDEPFSALDTITKDSMHEWYINVMRQIKLSTLFITHDVDEAIQLSDRIYILGQKPASIISEIIIEKSDVRTSSLILSNQFIEYKKEIIAALEL